jgi:hypothetical protein
MNFERYYPILGGANIGRIARTIKHVAFRLLPELIAGTNVFELALPKSPVATSRQ